MKKAHRNTLLRQYHHLYRRHFVEEAGCFYCGSEAETLDHVPPVSWVDSRSTETWRKDKVPFVLIKCCRDCNTLLADRPLFSTLERTEFLYKKYSKQYEKHAALWSDEEIEELGSSLQEVVRAKRNANNLLLDKIRILEKRLVKTESHPESRDSFKKDEW